MKKRNIKKKLKFLKGQIQNYKFVSNKCQALMLECNKIIKTTNSKYKE